MKIGIIQVNFLVADFEEATFSGEANFKGLIFRI